MVNTQNQGIDEQRPVAYSYVRFSTSRQELGDSLRRQVQMAEEYCVRNNLQLHPVSFRDLGVSAFKRKNIEKGALAAFIEGVRTGKIPKGSYLIIEQFDRLSRADIDYAVKLLLDLVHNDVKLITLVDEKIWDRESVKDIGNLILAIVFMSRANNESAMKADRISKAWTQKKKSAGETGKILTRECPRWLQVSADGKTFEVLEDRVESIRKVFEHRVLGHGCVAIINKANREQWPVPGKGDSWHTSLIGRLLNNRALLGEYQPHKNGEEGKRIPVGDPILNYYPAVIDEQTFLRAHSVSERKGEFPGRRDINYRNFLQGLLRCSCGQSFVRKNKASSKQKDYARYYCTARNRGLSDCLSLSSKEIETAVLHSVAIMAPQYFEGTARAEELKTSIEMLRIELGAAEQKRERFAEAIGSATPAAVSALVKHVEAAQTEVDTLKQKLDAQSAELADLESSDADDVFAAIVNAVKTQDSLDARSELRENLSRVLLRCVVHAKERYIEMYFRGHDVPVNVPLGEDSEVPGLSTEAPEGFGGKGFVEA